MSEARMRSFASTWLVQVRAFSARRRRWRSSAIRAEVAAEGVGLLHQRLARHHFEHLPIVLFVLHVLLRLTSDNDDGADQLMILRTETHVAHHRWKSLALLILLDHVWRIKSSSLGGHARP